MIIENSPGSIGDIKPSEPGVALPSRFWEAHVRWEKLASKRSAAKVCGERRASFGDRQCIHVLGRPAEAEIGEQVVKD